MTTVAASAFSDQNAAARLAGLLDSAMDAIISVDEGQRIVLYNRAAERIFGWPAARILGEPLELLLPQRFRRTHADQVRHFGATGVTSRRMGGRTVLYGLRANGEEFPVDASISQLDSPDGKLYTGPEFAGGEDKIMAAVDQMIAAERRAGAGAPAAAPAAAKKK